MNFKILIIWLLCLGYCQGRIVFGKNVPNNMITVDEDDEANDIGNEIDLESAAEGIHYPTLNVEYSKFVKNVADDEFNDIGNKIDRYPAAGVGQEEVRYSSRNKEYNKIFNVNGNDEFKYFGNQLAPKTATSIDKEAIRYVAGKKEYNRFANEDANDEFNDIGYTATNGELNKYDKVNANDEYNKIDPDTGTSITNNGIGHAASNSEPDKFEEDTYDIDLDFTTNIDKEDTFEYNAIDNEVDLDLNIGINKDGMSISTAGKNDFNRFPAANAGGEAIKNSDNVGFDFVNGIAKEGIDAYSGDKVNILEKLIGGTLDGHKNGKKRHAIYRDNRGHHYILKHMSVEKNLVTVRVYLNNGNIYVEEPNDDTGHRQTDTSYYWDEASGQIGLISNNNEFRRNDRDFPGEDMYVNGNRNSKNRDKIENTDNTLVTKGNNASNGNTGLHNYPVGRDSSLVPGDNGNSVSSAKETKDKDFGE